MKELEQLVAQVEQAILAEVTGKEFRPGRVSVWTKLVRPVVHDGIPGEETVGELHKHQFVARSFPELVRSLAEQIVLTIYGAEIQIVTEIPDMVLKLYGHKTRVKSPFTPARRQADPLYLKVTVYYAPPSLWENLFHRQANMKNPS